MGLIGGVALALVILAVLAVARRKPGPPNTTPPNTTSGDTTGTPGFWSHDSNPDAVRHHDVADHSPSTDYSSSDSGSGGGGADSGSDD